VTGADTDVGRIAEHQLCLGCIRRYSHRTLYAKIELDRGTQLNTVGASRQFLVGEVFGPRHHSPHRIPNVNRDDGREGDRLSGNSDRRINRKPELVLSRRRWVDIGCCSERILPTLDWVSDMKPTPSRIGLNGMLAASRRP